MNYFYVAKNLEGQTHTGQAQAENERQLAQNLRQDNLILVKATSQEKRKSNWLSFFNVSLFKVSSLEKIMLVKNLGVMFSAGLSLVKCFDILANQSKNSRLKNALLKIKERVNKGEDLAESLKMYPDIFSDLFVNMVKVGEESGTLDEILQILALQMGREHELKTRIRNAMIYPALIVMVMIAVGVIIVTFVLPSLSVFFSSLNADIPLSTKIVLAAGGFLTKNWYLMILVPVLLAAAFMAAIKTQNGKKLWHYFLLKMPLISPIVKKNNSAFFVRSLSSLLIAGISLNRALEIISKTMRNYYFEQALVESQKKIERGGKLSKALDGYGHIFPFGVVEMIEVGEETGKTGEILKKLADFYEQEAIAAVERLAGAIEPALIIVLGLSVGFFAFSIIQPMYSSLQFVSE